MSLPRVSPRRKSLGLTERNMNFDDDNLTLPVTLKPKKRGVSIGGDLASSSSFDGLSEMQRLRRAARPRKSILKLTAPEDEENTANYAETIDFGSLYKGRQSLGPSRRVSFAPSAHVRMFEKEAKKPRRKSSMGVGFRQSESPAKSSLPPMPRRRSSIQAVQPPPVAPQYFVGEGDGGGEESMEIESDESANSDEILAEITALSPKKPASAASSDMSDSEDEMSMDETVIGGGIVWDHGETTSDSDGSDMDISQAEEEKTMDFTVALGGVVPVQPPKEAKRSRHSIGYSHPLEPGAEPLRPGDSDGADHSGEMEMEETAIYGGVYGGMHDDSTISSGDSTGMEHTATYAMDFTEFGGGIVREPTIRANDTMGSGMDMTEVVGGVVRDVTQTEFYTSSGGMDFTEAGGGIAYQSTEVYGRTMTTNIFAPQPTPAPVSAPESAPAVTPKSLSSSTGISRPATDTATTVRRNPFAPTPGSEKPIMKNIFATTPAPAPASAQGTPRQRRMSTPRAPTPARPQAMSTPKSSASKPAASTPKGTPSFARPTASSVKKAELGKSPAKLATKSPAKVQKRNVFAPSPDEPNPTPRKGMQAAASVAKKLDFTPTSTPGSTRASVKTRSSTTPLAASVQPTALSTPGKRKRDADDDDEEEEAPSRKQQAIEAPLPRESTSTEPTPIPSPTAVASQPFSAEPSPSVPPQTASSGSTPAPVPVAVESLKFTSASSTPEQSGTPSDELPKSLPTAAAASASAEPSSSLPDLRVESLDGTPAEADVEPEVEKEEEDMSLEDDMEEQETADDDVASERETTPEPIRPLPTFTPTPRRSLGGRPRPSLGTPMRVLSASTASLTLDRDPTPPPSPPPEVSGPVPLATFLETVGVRFLDDMNPHLPGPRRSSFAPRVPHTEDQLHDFTAANLESIFLHMYDWAIGRMTSELSHGREEIASTTRVCDAENPPVVRDYYECSEEERALYESTLRNFKTKALLEAQGGWYDWRLGLMDRILPDVTTLHSAMMEESERHALNAEVAAALLPDLEERHVALTSELEENRAQVAEIAECDPTELADLKAAVVEQEEEISRFTAELEAKERQLAELEREEQDLAAKEREHDAALAVAKGMCDDYTSSDVRRLSSELKQLEALHGWRVVHTAPLEMTYAGELRMIVPDVMSPELSLLPTKPNLAKEDGVEVGLTEGNLTQGLLQLTRSALLSHLSQQSHPTLSMLVQAAGQLWTAARRLRAELKLLDLYYPSSYIYADILQCSARLMLPRVKSRASLSFSLGPETLLRWPEPSAFDVAVGADIAYGKADKEKLQEIARETLQSAVPHVPGVLLQACVEAAALYK